MRKQFLIQALIVVGFMLLPLLFMAGEWAAKGEFFLYNPYDPYSIIVYLGLLASFFLNYYVLIPQYYSRKKYLAYALSIICISLILISTHYFVRIRPHQQRMKQRNHFHQKVEQHHQGANLSEHHHRPMHRHSKKPPPFFQLSQYLFLLLLGMLTGLYLRVRNNLILLTDERNKASIASLKSQINPHFLFNMLNSIYALAVKEHAQQTANGMLKLSGMMRYVLSDSTNEFVPLEQELSYISSYIELQKLRLDKGIDFSYLVEGEAGQLTIAPLILIPFIENCFKHGVNPDANSIIMIKISIRGSLLNLICRNNIVLHGHHIDEKLGLGIKNTSERLKLLYPGRHELSIKEDKQIFQADLTLQLT